MPKGGKCWGVCGSFPSCVEDTSCRDGGGLGWQQWEGVCMCVYLCVCVCMYCYGCLHTLPPQAHFCPVGFCCSAGRCHYSILYPFLAECNCTENGVCNGGLHGDGFCFCAEGWTGERCETRLGEGCQATPLPKPRPCAAPQCEGQALFPQCCSWSCLGTAQCSCSSPGGVSLGLMNGTSHTPQKPRVHHLLFPGTQGTSSQSEPSPKRSYQLGGKGGT